MYMSQTSLANRYKIVKKCIQKKIKAGASDQNSNADFFLKSNAFTNEQLYSCSKMQLMLFWLLLKNVLKVC